MNLYFLLVTTCSAYLPLIFAVAIDNGVVDDPEIKCADSFIGIKFQTRNPFFGHVFIKSHFAESACRTDATNKTDAQIQVQFTSCGVKRLRSANPRGMFVSVTVIITFHAQFITKVDKAFDIQCFYMEAEKIVTAELEVSMLTTSFQTQTVPMPTCRYEVLDNGPTGNAVRFAKIGQQVYHKWTCDTSTSETFCMVVHSCNVDDGTGNKVDLLGSNGCAQDKHLLGNLEYLNDLMAGKESHVFKYADRPSLFFNCQISIAVKEPGVLCPRPICSEPSRGKRNSVNVNISTLFKDVIDVDSSTITVLDLDQKRASPKVETNSGEDVCMSLVGLTSYTFVNVMLVISSCLLFMASYRKQLEFKD